MNGGMPPEWAEVEAKAHRMEAAQPENIQSITGAFRIAATNTGPHADELHAATNGLQDRAWEGESADAFFTHAERIGKAGARLRVRLVTAADDLDRLEQSLRDLRNDVGELVHLARTTIEQNSTTASAAATKAAAQQDAVNRKVVGAVVPARTPDAILADAAETNSATAKAAAGDLDALLAKADALLDQVCQQLGQNLDGSYSQLPLPGRVKEFSAGATGGGATSPRGAPNYSATLVKDAPPAKKPAVGNVPIPEIEAKSKTLAQEHTHSGGGAGAAAAPVTSSPGPTGGPPATSVSGDVGNWVEEAIGILRANGVPVTDADIAKIASIIKHESSGNPYAINNTDSNAAAGHPSKGLMQCIDSTFQAYKLPGHDDIYNPVDNIIAGMRYIFDRYGSIDNHPGLKSMVAGGAYQGY